MNKKNVKFYNRKCKGCGSYLSSDENSPSYVPNFSDKTLYCMRCFRLKHYGEISNNVKNEDLTSTISKIDTNDDLVALILDLFDFDGSIINEYKNKKNIIILINKITVLPKNFNRELAFKSVQNMLSELEINNYLNVILYDAKNKSGIRTIYEELVKLSKRKKIYFVGKTNVGKSSLINALLSLKKKEKLVTISPYKNTTLDLNKIEIDKNLTIIDTPGYPSENFFSIINNETTKNILESKFTIKSFQQKKMNCNQSYIFSGLMSISIIENDNNSSITYYGYDKVSIHRTKFENIDKKILNNTSSLNLLIKPKNIFDYSLDLDKNKKYIIFLSGIGFVVLKRVSKIKIHNILDKKLFISDFSII